MTIEINQLNLAKSQPKKLFFAFDKLKTNYPVSSSLFGRAYTPSQLQTGLGPKVYHITTVLDAGSDVVKLVSRFRHPKPSDLVRHVMPHVLGTILGRGLPFV